MAACSQCGKPAGFMMNMCQSCIDNSVVEAKTANTVEAEETREAREAAIEAVQVTTAQSLAGYRIVRTVDIVSAECVLGMNFLQDFLASLSDVFGGRSGTTQNTLREARRTCMHELRREAHRVGANAIIAIDLDYAEFSGQGKSMVILVANGTAVTVQAEAPDGAPPLQAGAA